MDNPNLKVVILAGGLGLRMRDYSTTIPKALVPIGEMALIEHVMRLYMHHGFNDFIICTGYMGEQINAYFKSKKNNYSDANIELVDTGLETQTGGRLKKIEGRIKDEMFMVTYCDGLSDVDIKKLYEFHLQEKRIATLTAVHPMSPFGIIEMEGDVVVSFREKPKLPGYINGGFFVFNRKIFDYLNEDCVLEEEPMKKLVAERQLGAYRHDGYWSAMDSAKDVERLNALWYGGTPSVSGTESKKVPWKTWE